MTEGIATGHESEARRIAGGWVAACGRLDLPLVALLVASVFNGLLWALLGRDVPDEVNYMKEVVALVDRGVFESFTGHRVGIFTVIASVFVRIGRLFGFTDLTAARLVGVACVTIVAWLAYRTALTLLPRERNVALLAAALLIFNPMYTFINASVTPDTLLVVAASTAVYACVLILRDRPTLFRIALLAGAMVFGMLTKERMVVVLPLLALLPALYFLPKVDWATFFGSDYWAGEMSPKAKMSAIAGVGALVIAGVAFKTWSGAAAPSVSMYALTSPTQVMALVRDGAFNERLLEQAWAYFGYLHVPAPLPFYELFKGAMLFGMLGLALMGARGIADRIAARRAEQPEPPDLRLPLSLALLACAFFFALYGTAQYHLISNGGSQGRYLFVAATPFYVLMAVGLSRLVPDRYRAVLISVLIVGALFANLYGLLYVMSPYFY